MRCEIRLPAAYLMQLQMQNRLIDCSVAISPQRGACLLRGRNVLPQPALAETDFALGIFDHGYSQPIRMPYFVVGPSEFHVGRKAEATHGIG